MTTKEKKNRTIAFSIAIAIHLLLLLSWGGVMAWEAPGPPAEFPEVGIIVVEGTDIEGMESDNETEVKNDSEDLTDVTEEVPEEADDVPETTPENDVTEPNPDPVNETPTEVLPDDNSESTETVIPENTESSTKASEANTDETASKPKKTKPVVGFTKGDGDTPGNKGVEDGVKDVKTYEGKQGSGSLGSEIGNIPGFGWKERPKIDKIPFDATVKMQVTVNIYGEITNVKFLECPYNDPAVRDKIIEQLKKAKLEASSRPDGNTFATILWAFKAK